jgi:hypothetical protein
MTPRNQLAAGTTKTLETIGRFFSYSASLPGTHDGQKTAKS